MAYVSNTAQDRKEMLAAIGVATLDELLTPIPETIRLTQSLNIPSTTDEYSLVRHLQKLSAQNFNADSNLCFLGAGIYDHFRPSVVPALQSRGEFLTAYTPYQPEMSQGVLQGIYEYQTLICALTGMDISNASMYDAATGMAEAALMATSLTDRSDILISKAVHPHYRDVVLTYANATGYRVVEVDVTDGKTDIVGMRDKVNGQTACIILQHPNFFGYLEDVQLMADLAESEGALSIVSVDPISLGLLKPPGAYNVDIVVGEGQALGSPMGFGGPLLGFYACKKKFVRSFPGRIVGATHDSQGRRGYTMTLRTREQDIRREKATSNICTNQALIALAATIYLCELGKNGLAQVADLCLQKAHYAYRRLLELPGVLPYAPETSFFKEFVVLLPKSPTEVNRALLEQGILGGLDLTPYHHEIPNGWLVCVTETKSREDIDRLVDATRTILEGR